MFDTSSFNTIRDKLTLRRLSKPALVGIILLITALLASAIVSFVHASNATAVVISTAENAHESSSASSSTAVKGTSSGSGSASASVDAGIMLYVHVTGCVNQPGLYEVPAGSRVGAAIESAGGFSDDADTASINLARPINDGEQIIVLAQSESSEGTSGGQPSAAYLSENESSCNAASSTLNGLVNINRATSTELQSVPGIGPATAQKIINDRTANGSFASVDDLTRVSGIGEKRLESMRPYLTVG